MVVVCAIKGPSWYKLFHNYRHRRLQQQEEEDDDDIISRVFTKSRSTTNQTFTFNKQNGQREEEVEEDGYHEDQFVKPEGDGEPAKHEEAKDW